MCVDVYSSSCPLTIKYSYELVRFNGARSFVGRYTLLVENAGKVPLDELLLVYPRPLMDTPSVDGKRRASLRISDMAPGLLKELQAGVHNDKTLTGNRMLWQQPDPNDPAAKIPDLDGILDPSNTKFTLPLGITPSHVSLISECQMSAWSLRFSKPLQPNDRHWITFMVSVENAGIGVSGLAYGDVLYHRLASPCSVWRLFSETMLAGKETVYGPLGHVREDVNTAIGLYDTIVKAFGLNKKRDVRIEHYLLEVNPGNVTERVLLCPTVDGDLWMRSASPMVVPGHTKQDPKELAFLWKSGVKLQQFIKQDPTPETMRDVDFILQFAIVSKSSPSAELWTNQNA